MTLTPRCLFTSLAICLFFATGSAAATIYVTPMGGDAPNIQAGIGTADPGDTILLSDGWFAGNGNRDIDFMGKSVVVRSQSGDPFNCVIYCQGTEQQPHAGFIFQTGETPDAVVEGITIQSAWGAGVYCDPDGQTEGASPTFRNCRFVNNVGPGLVCFISQPTIVECVFGYNSGDGVTLNESNVFFDRCVFTSNVSAGLDGYGWVTAANCEFTNNGEVGAIVRGNQADFTDCEFSANFGGGVISDEAELGLTDCFVYDNDILGVKLIGSALPTDTTHVVLTRCTLWDNRGSGLIVENGAAHVSRCTIYGNSSPQGAGVHCVDGALAVIERSAITFNLIGQAVFCDATSDATVECSDVFANDGGDWVGCITDDENGTGNFSADPWFCDPDYGNFTLSSVSALLAHSNFCNTLIGAHDLGCHEPVAVDPDGLRPFDAPWMEAYPNPFNPVTTIRFSIARPARITLDIFNAAGQLVRRLLDEQGEPTSTGYTVEWNGTDADGEPVGSGVYFCRLAMGDRSLTTKLVLLK